MKFKMHLAIFLWIFTSSILPVYSCETDNETSKIENVNHFKSQFEKNIELIKTVLNEKAGDRKAYHPLYKNLVDQMIELLKVNNLPSKDLEETLREQMPNPGFNQHYITYMLLQTAMVLTPQQERKREFADSTAERINFLLSPGGLPKTEKWQDPFNPHYTPDNLIEKEIFLLHSLISIVPYFGNGVFEPKDFLKCFAEGIFLVAVSPKKKNGVHGGIARTPIEIAVHDLLHIIQQFFPPIEKKINLFDIQTRKIVNAVFLTYRDIAKKCLNVLDDKTSTFKEIEKKQLEIFFFYAFHEVDFNFYEIGTKYFNKNAVMKAEPDTACEQSGRGAVNKGRGRGPLKHKIKEDVYPPLPLNAALKQIMEDYNLHINSKYPDKLNSQDEFYKKPNMMIINISHLKEFRDRVLYDFGDPKKAPVMESFGGIAQYTYAKLFLRDSVHLLKQSGLYPICPEKLGIDYPVTDTRSIYLGLSAFVEQELKPEGRLYPFFYDKQ